MSATTPNAPRDIVLGDCCRLMPGDPRWNALLYFDTTHIFVPCDEGEWGELTDHAMGMLSEKHRSEVKAYWVPFSSWLREMRILSEAGIVKPAREDARESSVASEVTELVRQYHAWALTVSKDGTMDLSTTRFPTEQDAVLAAVGCLLAKNGLHLKDFSSPAAFGDQMKIYFATHDSHPELVTSQLSSRFMELYASFWYPNAHGIPALTVQKGKHQSATLLDATGKQQRDFVLFHAGLRDSVPAFRIENAEQILEVRYRCNDSLARVRTQLALVSLRFADEPDDAFISRFLIEELRPAMADFKSQAKSLPERLLRSVLPDVSGIIGGAVMGLSASTVTDNVLTKTLAVFAPLAGSAVSRFVNSELDEKGRRRTFPYRFFLET